MAWKKKPRSRDPLEVRKVIFNTCRKMRKAGLKELEGYNGHEQWLMFGRILNIMFQQHYKVSLETAEEVLHRQERERL